MEIVSQYSWWYLLPGVLLAAGIAFIVYQKINFEAPLPVRRLLMALRFILIGLLIFLLLEPLIKSFKNTTEKPILLLAHDNSHSITLAGDTNYLYNTYLPEWEKLKEKLSDKYQVETATYGESFKLNNSLHFNEKQTDIGTVFTQAATNYYNRNFAAIVLAGDGIYNLGENPAFLNYTTPVFTVGLGDTSLRFDLSVARVNHNLLTYKNNLFPVEVLVKGIKASGKKTNVAIYEGNTKLSEQEIIFKGNNEIQSLNFLLQAQRSGLIKFTAKITNLPNELSINNNHFDFYVEVIEDREKVLLLAASPHPDVNAIKQALETNQNLSVEVQLATNFTKNIKDYNLVILHQIPSNNNDKTIINQLKTTDVPVLYICGTQSNYNALSELSGYNFTGVKPAPNDALPLLDESFGLFNLSENFTKAVNQFPPLSAVYGNYKSKQEANVFIRQQIGNVKTNLPLIAFTSNNNHKEGFIFGEGIWRWRLNDFLHHENHQAFDELINKITQYLSVKIDRSRFKIRTLRSVNETDEIILTADYYNETYELNNSSDATLKLINSKGKDFSYVFLKEGNSYRLNLGQLPPDEYVYSGEIKLGNKIFTDKGSFTVKALQAEGQDLTANHALLKQISQKSGGQFFYANQLAQLADTLNTINSAKPIIYTQRIYNDLINMPWLFFIALLLVTTEWFIRKYFGGY